MKHLNALQEKRVINYLMQTPELFIDSGASRMVFKTTTDINDYLDLPEKDCNAYIIKIAMGLGGLTQMETEVDTYENYKDTGCFAEIVAIGRYIEIMEAVDVWDFSDYTDDGDYPDLYEEIMEAYDLPCNDAKAVADTMSTLTEIFGYTSDNGQLGQTSDGRWVAYDYGFIPGNGCDSQTSDICDYIWHNARRYVYLKGLTDLLNKEYDFMEDWEHNFLREHCGY